MKWTITGFSCYRVGLVAAILSFGLVPMHFFVCCEASERLGFCAMGIVVLNTVLAVVGGVGKMTLPLMLAVVALIAHALCAH